MNELRNARTLKRSQDAWDDRAEPDEDELLYCSVRIGDGEAEAEFVAPGGFVCLLSLHFDRVRLDVDDLDPRRVSELTAQCQRELDKWGSE